MQRTTAATTAQLAPRHLLPDEFLLIPAGFLALILA
jgi:hypothetical protein